MKKNLCLTTLLLPLTLAIVPIAGAGLAESDSDFVRQHADSPIQWQTWGPEAIQRAVDEDKPVYVFVGSFLNEMVRLTIRDSFSDPKMIEILNSDFVCVLVDREERPDVDAAAQHYLNSVKQTHGHPTHIWLTPEMQPFEGSGYLPPSEDWGQPGFTNVVDLVVSTWKNSPEMCQARGREAQMLMALPDATTFPAYSEVDLDQKRTRAVAAWLTERGEPADRFGPPPRKPEPELYRTLLSGSESDREFALNSLKVLAGSGLRDPLDGGFFRYATDANGHVPYLQKTLTDQARLALAYLDATTSRDDVFAKTAEGLMDYCLSTLVHPAGDFAAAQDATAGDGAAYYTWSEDEVKTLLGPDADTFIEAYGITAEGNVSSDDDMPGRFTGRNILSRSTATDDKTDIGLPAAAWEALITTREGRTPPTMDQNATAGAHGLVLAALSRAGAELDLPKYLSAAERTYNVIRERFVHEPNTSVRRLADSSTPGAPTDYLGLALGCRAYAEATGIQEAADLADQLLARSRTLFFDSSYSRYLAAPAPLPAGLFIRPPAQPNPLTPEALALMAGPSEELSLMIRQRLVAIWNPNTLAPADILLALTR